jgi:hypothetical protein
MFYMVLQKNSNGFTPHCGSDGMGVSTEKGRRD